MRNKKPMIRYIAAVILTGGTIAVFLGFFGCAQPNFNEDEWHKTTKSYSTDLLYAEHRDKDGKFFNPWLKMPSLFSLAFRKMTTKNTSLPQFDPSEFQHIENDYSYLSDRNNSITFLGHASFVIQLDSAAIFLDPFLSDRAGIVAKEIKIPFNYDFVPSKPIVLISHNHYDHLDIQSIESLIKKDAIFIVGLELGEYIKSIGATEVYELDWWQSVTIEGIKYTFLPAQHWSRRLRQGADTTLWGCFLIEGSKSIYFSGDTGYFRGFEEFGKRYTIDYALVGVGAYEPRWFMHYQHLNVDEFFYAAKELNATLTIPMHLGVIQLGDEHYLYPLYDIAKRATDGDRIKTMRVRERLMIK